MSQVCKKVAVSTVKGVVRNDKMRRDHTRNTFGLSAWTLWRRTGRVCTISVSSIQLAVSLELVLFELWLVFPYV